MNTFTHILISLKMDKILLSFFCVLSFSNLMFAQKGTNQSEFQTSTSQINEIFTVLGDFRNNTVFSCVSGFDFAKIAQDKGGTVHSQTLEDFSLNPFKKLSSTVSFHKMYFINTFHTMNNHSEVLILIKKFLKPSGECYFIQKSEDQNRDIIKNSTLTIANIVNKIKQQDFHFISIDTSSIKGYSLIRIDNYAPANDEH